MGMEMKPRRTKMTHTLSADNGNVGFDFLGYTVRQFPAGKTHMGKAGGKGRVSTPLGFKSIIKPSNEAIRRHSLVLAEIVEQHKPAPPGRPDCPAQSGDQGLDDLLRARPVQGYLLQDGSPDLPQAPSLGQTSSHPQILSRDRQEILGAGKGHLGLCHQRRNALVQTQSHPDPAAYQSPGRSKSV